MLSPCLANSSAGYLLLPKPRKLIPPYDFVHRALDPRATPFLAFEGDADAIESMLSAISKTSLPFSCRIFARTPNSIVFRIMPAWTHETCTAMLSNEINYVARNIFQNPSVWPVNVLCTGSIEVQLPTKRKQADASWTPEGHMAPTVVLEVGSAENLSVLQGDMWTWFAKGSETRFVLLAAVHDKRTPLSMTVQGFVRAVDPRVQDPKPVMIYEAQWNGDWTSTQPLSIPLQFFLPDDFQFPVENPPRENMDPQVELGVEVIEILYNAVVEAAAKG
ncbi:hypothetical protein GGX14DRAFT_447805 [Mycena pura]|uniref:Uncharacterized protein n=1 Tax=Mycena pura TaxID=153505 RepID=A0AAD6YCU1_9AGAR|nr:hypothetical protein GGX14DRAFT_447805 [Mycena pura]